MKKLLFLVLPIFVYAQTLAQLIEIAEHKNDLVLAKQLTQKSRTKDLESKNSMYFPTVDLGGFYKRDDEASPFQPGTTYSGYAKLSYDIYDGGKRNAYVKQSKKKLLSSRFDTEAFKKSLALQITEDFFTIKTLQASLIAREEAQKTLKAQLLRIARFVKVKIATPDDLDRVQADYDTNSYEMASIRFQILSQKAALSLKVGEPIQTLENSRFVKNENISLNKLDATQALIAKQNSIVLGAEAIDSFYYPNIKIEDTYNFYGYANEAVYAGQTIHYLDKQNSIMLTLNFRLFDYGALHDTKESILLSSQALTSQINYQTKEQEMQFTLAKARITTAKLRIKSSKSALLAAINAFKTIEKKYNAGIVDYIIYLNALSKKTSSKSLYEAGLNELELAYALYYYYSGKNLKEELQ